MRFDTGFNFKDFRKDIAAALEAVERKYGVKFEQGNGSYDANKFSMKVTALNASVDTAKLDFERYCYRYGLKPEHYGAEVNLLEGTFTIVGINPKASKYPIEVERVADCKRFGYTAAAIAKHL